MTERTFLNEAITARLTKPDIVVSGVDGVLTFVYVSVYATPVVINSETIEFFHDFLMSDMYYDRREIKADV